MPTVVVTDSTFPDVAQERAAAEAQGCAFNAHQCRSAEEVAEANRRGNGGRGNSSRPSPARPSARLAPGAAIIRYGIGYDNIDIAAARELGVPVGYVPDYCTEEVAEHTCASLLALLRKLPALDASVRAGRWEAVAVARPVKPFDRNAGGLFFRLRADRPGGPCAPPCGVRLPVRRLRPRARGGRTPTGGPSGWNGWMPRRCSSVATRVCLHAPANARTNGIINAPRRWAPWPRHGGDRERRPRLAGGNETAARCSAGSRRDRRCGAWTSSRREDRCRADSPLRDAPQTSCCRPTPAWYSEGRGSTGCRARGRRHNPPPWRERAPSQTGARLRPRRGRRKRNGSTGGKKMDILGQLLALGAHSFATRPPRVDTRRDLQGPPYERSPSSPNSVAAAAARPNPPRNGDKLRDRLRQPRPQRSTFFPARRKNGNPRGNARGMPASTCLSTDNQPSDGPRPSPTPKPNIQPAMSTT